MLLLTTAIWLLTFTTSAMETVRFATMDFAPYAIVDGKDGRRGLFMDMDAAIADKAEVNMTDTILPVARVMKNLEHGVSDCAVFLLSPWSRAKFVAVAEAIGRFESIVVTRKGLPIKRIEDLYGRLLALPRGSYPDFPISTDPNILRYHTKGYAQSARILKAGRVDAIAGTAIGIFHNLSNLNMTRKDIGGVLAFDHKPIWLLCTKNKMSDEIIARLRRLQMR